MCCLGKNLSEKNKKFDYNLCKIRSMIILLLKLYPLITYFAQKNKYLQHNFLQSPLKNNILGLKIN